MSKQNRMTKPKTRATTVEEINSSAAPAETMSIAQEALSKLDSNMSISAKIRALSAAGISRGDIARVLNKKYQHIRNVLTTQLKRPAGE